MTIRKRTKQLPNGTKVVHRQIIDNGDLEWRQQAEAVRQLKRRPGYGSLFAYAGDMNAGRRGPKDRVKAKATGMMSGEPDLRIYLRGGQTKFIEFKKHDGVLSAEQRDRHKLLKSIGFDVVVVQSTTTEEAAKSVMDLMDAWLPESRSVH